VDVGDADSSGSDDGRKDVDAVQSPSTSAPTVVGAPTHFDQLVPVYTYLFMSWRLAHLTMAHTRACKPVTHATVCRDGVRCGHRSSSMCVVDRRRVRCVRPLRRRAERCRAPPPSEEALSRALSAVLPGRRSLPAPRVGP
jgi:hypothetical protein